MQSPVAGDGLSQRIKAWAVVLLFVPFVMGCTRMAIQFSSSLLPQFAESIFEEYDAELARTAIPANLKLMEGLLKSDPSNREILTNLCMGLAGYSMLFIEEEDPERASQLYWRARAYGVKALGSKGVALDSLKKESLTSALKAMDRGDLQPLLWATVSWNAWVNLNLDKPTALAQANLAEISLERILEIDPEYLYGLPYLLKGTILAARPPMLGGKPQAARAYFERAMRVSGGKFFMAQYLFARYYAVRVQDKNLFSDLVQSVLDGDPQELGEACLMNTVIQQKAVGLKGRIDDLFI